MKHFLTILSTSENVRLEFGIASALAGAGSDIVLVARTESPLEQAEKELGQFNRKIWTYPYDMSNIDGIGDIFARITEDTGGIDVLVNNAGGTRRGPAESLTTED